MSRLAFLLIAVFGIALPSSRAAASPVTLQSLLAEMVDREGVAKWPAPTCTLKQASSYDRAQTDPANPKTWHANNDHDQFIRVDTSDGRKEWVLMEATGPGVLTRLWVALPDDTANPGIRFYFDGSATPASAVHGPCRDL